jgi:formylglycine-generating enzyme required for sulfatase activity
MIVLAPGSFMMGAAATEKDPFRNSSPQHQVTIQNALAVAKFDVTFDEWDACVSVGACYDVTDGGMGRGNKPVINVTWNDAQQYVRWLSAMTGAQYRLATEAEWEYAARAGTTTAYYWGDSIGTGNANCGGCGSKWDSRDTSPVGSFAPNSFGLYDMLGNVWQWVEDCYHDNYKGAPIDGSAWVMRSCSRHVVRGGSWSDSPQELHSAVRNAVAPDARVVDLSFRVARTLPVAK